VDALLRRPDVDCVSVKVSSVAAGLSLIDFEGSVARITGPLRASLPARPAPPVTAKLVNLDMEEHRDLDLTVESFLRLLDDDEFAHAHRRNRPAGLSPDTHAALDRLLDWAATASGGGSGPHPDPSGEGGQPGHGERGRRAPRLAGGPLPPPRPTPTPPTSGSSSAGGGVRPRRCRLVGVASHNLFDVALALILSEQRGRRSTSRCWPGWPTARRRRWPSGSGRLLFYVPATTRRDFRNALAYLARRLDENTTPEGFLQHVLDMVPGSPDWEDQADRFASRCASRHGVTTQPFQTQDRTRHRTGPSDDGPFINEPDTDLTVPANRRWARPPWPWRPQPAPAPVTGGRRRPGRGGRGRGRTERGRPRRPAIVAASCEAAADGHGGRAGRGRGGDDGGSGQDLRRGRSRGLRGRRLRPLVRGGDRPAGLARGGGGQ
jgi:RHH-type proline utilization regulon transcriptional repressor/proline dehydrogenase/delta 1-pyrroline-5-carboxylate dehydrogenase